jgi:hypothetical protein
MAQIPALTTLRFWINAFIPDPSLTPFVEPAPGASAGLSMIVVDEVVTKRYFLGDNRGYSNDPTAEARIHSLVDFSDLDQLSPTLSNTDIHCGLSTEIDPNTGAIIGTGTAPTSGISFANLRANESADPNGGLTQDSPSPNFVQLDYKAAASLPLLALSPDIDMFGTLQIDRDNSQFRFFGAVDGFPAFEAYVSFNGGPPVNLFQMGPTTPFALIGGANRAVDVTVPIA